MIVNFINDICCEKAHFHPEHLALDRIAVIILGGGEGKRLEPLTRARCKPAISFGGRYTLIDVPISHALSSGLRHIYVIGQYLASTLQKHLLQTYLHHGVAQNQIQMLVPEEREGGKVWYKGTADAIRQNLHYFSEHPADYFLILSGDQLYNINFQEMIKFAKETNASMVIAAQPVNEKDASRMGVMKLKTGGTKIIDFYEKPTDKEILSQYYTDDLTLHHLGYEMLGERRYLGSMGIYLFKREALFELLLQDPREDFGKHLIQTEMKKGDVHAFLYDGYWEDIGTIESYYYANLALTRHGDDRTKGFQCYDEKNLILTKTHHLPGAKISHTKVSQSILCEGSVVEADEIFRSVIGVRSVIKKGTSIHDSIVAGNEAYERRTHLVGSNGLRPMIGEGCLIKRAILDENVTLGNNVRLINSRGFHTFDPKDGEPEIFVRDGIIVVPRGTHIPDGFVF
jgi:glucose-1-phosphate adenylyltransferase